VTISFNLHISTVDMSNDFNSCFLTDFYDTDKPNDLDSGGTTSIPTGALATPSLVLFHFTKSFHVNSGLIPR